MLQTKNTSRKVFSPLYYILAGLIALLLPFQHQSQNEITDSLLVHISKDNLTCLYGLRDARGKWALPPQYNSINECFSRDFFILEKNEKAGLANRYGKEIIVPQYDGLSAFYFDEIRSGSSDSVTRKRYFTARKNGKKGLVDTLNKIILPIKYDNITLHYTDFFAAKAVWHLQLKNEKLYGLTNLKGLNVEPVFKHPLSCRNSDLPDPLFVFSDDPPDSTKNFRALGVVDQKGRIIVPPLYDSIYICTKPSNYIIVAKNRKDGLFDPKGKKLLDTLYKFNQNSYFFQDYFLRIKQSGKEGVIDMRTGKFIVPAEYYWVYDAYGPQKFFVAMTKDPRATNSGKSALYDVNGKKTLDTLYSFGSYDVYADSIVNVRQDKRKGLLDLKTGKFLLPLQYEYLENACRGCYSYLDSANAFIYKENGLYGLIGKNLKPIGKPRYTSIEKIDVLEKKKGKSFSHRCFIVLCNGKYGVVNIHDSVLIPFEYDTVITRLTNLFNDDFLSMIKNNKLFMFNKKNMLQPQLLNTKETGLSFENGIAEICITYQTGTWGTASSCGLVKEDGSILIPFNNERIYLYSSDKGLVFHDSLMHYGFITSTGKAHFLTEEFNSAELYSGKYLIVSTRSNKTGLMDTSARLLIDTNYYSITESGFDNYFFITTNSKKMGIADAHGKLIADTIYFALAKTREGESGFWVKTTKPVFTPDSLNCSISKNWGYINSNRKFILKPEWDFPSEFKDSTSIIWKNNLCGLVHMNGKILIPPFYNRILREKFGYFILEKNGLFGFADEKGKILAKPQWNRVTGFKTNYMLVYNGNNAGLVERNGTIIIPPLKNKFVYSGLDMDSLLRADTIPLSRKIVDSLYPVINDFKLTISYSYEDDDLSHWLNGIENLDPLQQIKDKKKRQAVSNFLISLWQGENTGLFELERSNPQKYAADVTDAYSSIGQREETYDYRWDDVEGTAISITAATETFFSFVKDNNRCYGDTKPPENCAREASFNNYAFRSNKMNALTLDSVFVKAAGFRSKLNSIIAEEIRFLDNQRIDCSDTSKFLARIGENFILKKEGVQFYIGLGQQQRDDISFKDYYIEINVSWKKIKHLLTKGFIKCLEGE